MSTSELRVRVSFSAREIEISGSSREVGEWWDRLDPICQAFSEQKSPPAATGGRGDREEDSDAGDNTIESFGEYWQEFPSTITDVEKMLVAASFVQSQDTDRTFTTGHASKLLSEQGIKLANPSQCVKQNVEKRHVFAHNGKYRVSKTGVDHLAELKRQAG